MIAPGQKTEQSFGHIKNGDVLAFRSRNIWSRLIRLRTSSRYSHVGFAVWIRGRLEVVEAKDWYYVRTWPLGRYLESPSYEIDHFELCDEDFGIDREKVVDTAWELRGSRYADVWQFVRSWGVFTNWLGTKLGWKKDTDSKRYHCSEMVLHCLRAGGYVGEGFDKDPAETSPGDVVQLPCLHRTGRVQRV